MGVPWAHLKPLCRECRGLSIIIYFLIGGKGYSYSLKTFSEPCSKGYLEIVNSDELFKRHFDRNFNLSVRAGGMMCCIYFLVKELLIGMPLLMAGEMANKESILTTEDTEPMVAQLKMSPARHGPVQPCWPLHCSALPCPARPVPVGALVKNS